MSSTRHLAFSLATKRRPTQFGEKGGTEGGNSKKKKVNVLPIMTSISPQSKATHSSTTAAVKRFFFHHCAFMCSFTRRNVKTRARRRTNIYIL